MNARDALEKALKPWFVGRGRTNVVEQIAASINRQFDAAGFTIMSKEDVETVRDKALEALQQIEGAACDGLEDGGYREALIEIRYAARKALPPHGGDYAS